MADHIQKALQELPSHLRQDAQVVYTAHSIPLSMAQGSKYVEQLEEACRLPSEHQAGRAIGSSIKAAVTVHAALART